MKKGPLARTFFKTLVPTEGLEPPHLAAHGPEPCASTNSATWALLVATSAARGRENIRSGRLRQGQGKKNRDAGMKGGDGVEGERRYRDFDIRRGDCQAGNGKAFARGHK